MDTKNREYQKTKVCPECKQPNLSKMSIREKIRAGFEYFNTIGTENNSNTRVLNMPIESTKQSNSTPAM